MTDDTASMTAQLLVQEAVSTVCFTLWSALSQRGNNVTYQTCAQAGRPAGPGLQMEPIQRAGPGPEMHGPSS